MDEQPRWLDGLAQADLVRARKASPAEVELNALVWEAGPGGAPAGAHAHDAALPLPATSSRFVGVPFLVKDPALEIEGTPFTEGSRWAAGTVPANTQEHARAGLVTLGKAAMCEFGLAPHCEPAVHGPMRNPWDSAPP